MISSRFGDLFDKPMLTQFLQGTAYRGTEFFMILYFREDGLTNILVTKTIHEVSAIADCFHNQDDIRRSDIKSCDRLSVNFFTGADLSDFI